HFRHRVPLPQVVLVDVLFADEEASTSVGDIDEERSVTSHRILRHEDVDVGRELDLTAGIARRLVDVDDDAIVGIGRIEHEVRPSLNPLVLTGQTEGFSPEVARAGGDVDMIDASENGGGEEEDGEGEAVHA